MTDIHDTFDAVLAEQRTALERLIAHTDAQIDLHTERLRVLSARAAALRTTLQAVNTVIANLAEPAEAPAEVGQEPRAVPDRPVGATKRRAATQRPSKKRPAPLPPAAVAQAEPEAAAEELSIGQVAAVAIEAMHNGRSPVSALVDAFVLTVKEARGYLRDARELGLVPPAQPTTLGEPQ